VGQKSTPQLVAAGHHRFGNASTICNQSFGIATEFNDTNPYPIQQNQHSYHWYYDL
jgi:hypothetical protein